MSTTIPTEQEFARQRLPLKKRLLTEPTLAPLIADAREAQGRYELALLIHDEHLNWRQHLNNARVRLSSVESADELAALRRKIVELNTEPDESERAARRLVIPVFDEFKAAVRTVFDAAAEVVEGHAVEIETAETLLFEQFGKSHQRTPLTGILDALRSEFDSSRDTLHALNPHTLPGAHNYPLCWFFE
jgi:hypothetical protein